VTRFPRRADRYCSRRAAERSGDVRP
jgi:hypothetical protein